MPRKRKEALRKTVPTKNGRLNIVVFERERKAKKGSDFYTEAYDINAERVTGVSTQEFRAVSSCYSEEEVIARVIARTIEKFESKEIIPHEKIDYAAAFATIPEEAYDALCLPSWGRSVRRSALTFFVKNSIAIIQTILDASVITEDTFRKAQEDMINIVKRHQHNREKLMQTKDTEEASEQGIAAAETRLDASAKKTADRRIFELNIIYQSSRLLLPEYDLPPIQIPRILLDKVVPVEQCKALPRDFLVGLAAIFTEEAEHSPFAAGGSLMLCSMLRPSEACAPKFGDILDFGTFGVYAVRKKVDSVTVEVVDALKSDAAHRTIIIPYFAMSILRRRKAYLAQKELTEEEVNNAYVVSKDDKPFTPISPRELSFYVKSQMEFLGCNDGFWQSVSMLMTYEPDVDEQGLELADPTAYALRRSGCSYLMNCSAAPRLSGESIPLFVLVDILMGHKLSAQDAKWKVWVSRADNWALIAQMMETIVLDPEHSAHPAFAPADTALFPEKICHSVQRLYVPEGSGQVTITIQAHSTDDVFFRFPQKGTAISYEQIVFPKEASAMPIIQEEIDRTFFEKAIGVVKKKFSKERGGFIGTDTESVQEA